MSFSFSGSKAPVNADLFDSADDAIPPRLNKVGSNGQYDLYQEGCQRRYPSIVLASRRAGENSLDCSSSLPESPDE